MFKRLDINLTVLLLLLDVMCTMVALHLAEVTRFALPFGQTLNAQQAQLHPTLYLMVAAIWAATLIVFVYEPRRIRHLGEEIYFVGLATVVATLLFAGALYLSYRDVSRLLFIYFCLIDVCLLSVLHIGLRVIRHARRPQGRTVQTLIVGAGKVGREVVAALTKDPAAEVNIVGYLDTDPTQTGVYINGIPVLGPLQRVAAIVREHAITEVIITLPHSAQQLIAHLALDLQPLPVRVWIVPDYYDLALARTRLVDLSGIPLVGLREPAIDGVRHIVKRVFDLSLSLVGLVVSAPLCAVIAVAIKLDSPGPILYKQQRVGENARLFWMYKFRSMTLDAERPAPVSSGAVAHKIKADPRVTRVGRVLRRTSLDELPQLLNVLKGEMSLVGPRPELPWLVDQYAAWQRRRFAVPPGMTGWWQVNGRSDRPMHLHTEDDLYYIQNYSLLLDLRILLKTVDVVVRGKGAF